MRKLICHLLGRHRPALVVVGFDEDHPVTAEDCPHCATHKHYVV
jgi:hypothetical protein